MRGTTIFISVLVLLALVAVVLGVLTKPSGSDVLPIAPADTRMSTPALSDDHLRIDDFELAAVSEEVWHPIFIEGRTRADVQFLSHGAHEHSRVYLQTEIVRPLEPEPSDVAGIIARLAQGRGRDVSEFEGISFWFNASAGLYIVQLGSARVQDSDHFNVYVEARQPGWWEVRLPFDSFRQEGYGREVQWTGRDLVHIAIYGVGPGSYSFAIDDLQFIER